MFLLSLRQTHLLRQSWCHLHLTPKRSQTKIIPPLDRVITLPPPSPPPFTIPNPSSKRISPPPLPRRLLSPTDPRFHKSIASPCAAIGLSDAVSVGGNLFVTKEDVANFGLKSHSPRAFF